MHTYQQGSGKIFDGAGALIGVGYSGHGAGLNNPAMEAVPGTGPIPVGKWRIVEWLDHHPHLGPCVARLAPVGHDAHGRSAFDIHGDNSNLNHTGSDGCIVTNRIIRQAWRDSGDLEIDVVE